MNKDVLNLLDCRNKLQARVFRERAEDEADNTKKELLLIKAEILEKTKVEELNLSALTIRDETCSGKKSIYYTDDYPIEGCVVKIFADAKIKDRFRVGIYTPTLGGEITQSAGYYPMNLEQAVKATECLLKRKPVPPQSANIDHE